MPKITIDTDKYPILFGLFEELGRLQTRRAFRATSEDACTNLLKGTGVVPQEVAEEIIRECSKETRARTTRITDWSACLANKSAPGETGEEWKLRADKEDMVALYNFVNSDECPQWVKDGRALGNRVVPELIKAIIRKGE